MPDQDRPQRQFHTLTVIIDRDLCIGSGNCAKVEPEVFELDDTNTVCFREGVVEADTERLMDACEVCPVNALIVRDAQGRQIVPAD